MSLGQDVSALSAENKALAQRAAGAEALAGSADASMAEMGARLKEASAENDRLVAAAAQVSGAFDTMRCLFCRAWGFAPVCVVWRREVGLALLLYLPDMSMQFLFLEIARV